MFEPRHGAHSHSGTLLKLLYGSESTTPQSSMLATSQASQYSASPQAQAGPPAESVKLSCWPYVALNCGIQKSVSMNMNPLDSVLSPEAPTSKIDLKRQY